MHISALTVCVNYAKHLRHGLERWQKTLDQLVVVTAERDTETLELCRQFGVDTYCTDVFWDNGAKFNKGRAIADCFAIHYAGRLPEWMLFFDADICPPEDWRTQVEAESPHCGNLYGCFRTNPEGLLFGDPDIAGYFHLAHKDDPHMQVRPIVDVKFLHAGNYDSTFQDRWQRGQRVRMPLRVVHHGDEPGANWCGVGNKHLVDELHRRRRRGHRWQNETVDNNPFRRHH